MNAPKKPTRSVQTLTSFPSDACHTADLGITHRKGPAIGPQENGLQVDRIPENGSLSTNYLFPAVICWFDSPSTMLVVATCCVVGEAIDRAEFYSDVEIMTPRVQVSYDLSPNWTQLKTAP